MSVLKFDGLKETNKHFKNSPMLQIKLLSRLSEAKLSRNSVHHHCIRQENYFLINRSIVQTLFAMQ